LDYNEKKYKYLADIQISQVSSLIDKEFAKNILKVEENVIDS